MNVGGRSARGECAHNDGRMDDLLIWGLTLMLAAGVMLVVEVFVPTAGILGVVAAVTAILGRGLSPCRFGRRRRAQTEPDPCVIGSPNFAARRGNIHLPQKPCSTLPGRRSPTQRTGFEIRNFTSQSGAMPRAR